MTNFLCMSMIWWLIKDAFILAYSQYHKMNMNMTFTRSLRSLAAEYSKTITISEKLEKLDRFAEVAVVFDKEKTRFHYCCHSFIFSMTRISFRLLSRSILKPKVEWTVPDISTTGNCSYIVTSLSYKWNF